ncbi:MAG: hypothetical protein ACTS44_00890 [Candidatus Hodgkinia cicadicola]
MEQNIARDGKSSGGRFDGGVLVKKFNPPRGICRLGRLTSEWGGLKWYCGS